MMKTGNSLEITCSSRYCFGSENRRVNKLMSVALIKVISHVQRLAVAERTGKRVTVGKTDP